MRTTSAWCDIPAGEFLMGNDGGDGFPADGEGPARRVALDAFRISPTAVTNAEFAQFVRDTHYATQAEQLGQSFVFYLQVPAAQRDAQRQVSAGMPWWLAVDDACWQRPEGPGSHVRDRPDHPVVHVSWHDAKAYCDWAGVRLPTEAQWEYAARGGLAQCRYPWGDELAPGGAARCNIWQGEFPHRPADGWRPGTRPVTSFEPNAWGLHNTAGNVWEWCEDWFCPAYHRDTAAENPLQARATGERSTRGGSFLCHDSYCNRYRVAARGHNTPSSSASNCGFRVVADPR
ncbi:formylglycine-generating enzyme family protein [Caenimonas aquaedulcis]|uniref:Formylglycine-generating enzyme family protein n=1 Tax=Caenimonas aquaedulcis TaxID=2793270 RepID=A0A931MGQ8_9BURK|nr:formylglycine-generating enzyme family protein [Caenimonas aquaedulcis]MBG9388233.1 formylglycine-generating enzyme family protein [Caenimonas aquaedulcis]